MYSVILNIFYVISGAFLMILSTNLQSSGENNTSFSSSDIYTPYQNHAYVIYYSVVYFFLKLFFQKWI